MKKTFIVSSMSCANCVRAVERVIKSVDGVQKASVNLSLKTAVVEYNCSEEKIAEAVKKAGYSITQNKEKKENGFINLIICLIFFVLLMYVSMGVMIGIPAPHFLHNMFYSAIIQLFLTAPILFVCRKYFVSGFKAIINKSANMDTLISIGALASLIFGIVMLIIKGQNISHEIYFESAGTIFTFITLGKYLEDKAKTKSADAVSLLLNMMPDTTNILTDEGEKAVDTSLVKVNDKIIIRAGDTVAHDAVITEGSLTVNQSAVTGESMPVFLEKGDNLISGSVCTDGHAICSALTSGMDTTLNKIIATVQNSISSKAPVSRVADKIAAVFVPIVCAISLITFIIWLLTGNGIILAFRMAISVLVISCPCALGLATPVAITAGMGKGANIGVLFKNAESLEKLHKVKFVCFDKTGTLTEGEPEVAEQTIKDNSFYEIAYGLENASNHPLASAVLKIAKKGDEVSDIKVLKGIGISGRFGGKNVFAYSSDYVKNNNLVSDNADISIINNYEKNGCTTIIFFSESKVLAILGIKDKIKSSSKKAISEIKKMGITPVMITGDNESVAKVTANKLGIYEYYASVMPEGKSEIVKKLDKAAMVGDGINDSPALASSFVGISVSKGSQIAVETAEVVLTSSEPEDVVKAIRLSKAVMKNIKENLFWAFFYNVLALPIAAGILYKPFGIALTPMLASACMSLSSIFVVLNALRIRLFYKEKKKKMKKIIYIDGMMCEHCKMNVEKTLSAISGVEKVEVDLEGKCAVVTETDDIPESLFKAEIEKVGYTFKGIKTE